MDEPKKTTEPEFTFVDAVPTGAAPTKTSGAPMGHSRFYCEKCRTVGYKIET